MIRAGEAIAVPTISTTFRLLFDHGIEDFFQGPKPRFRLVAALAPVNSCVPAIVA
jgi:hypothetical protein